jgi:hypothetical protein
MNENELETKENEGQFASLKFPALINFYKFTGIPKFQDTQEGQILIEKIEKYKEKITKKKNNNKIRAYPKFCVNDKIS